MIKKNKLQYFKTITAVLSCYCALSTSGILFGDACELANKILSAKDRVACEACAIEESPDNTWTITQAMNRSLSINPDFLTAKEEYERQSGAHIQAVSVLLPHVTFNAVGSERQKSLVDPDEVDPGATMPALRQFSLDIDFRQILFDGLSSLNKARSQLMEKQSAYWKMVDAGYILIAKVRSAFDNVLMRQDVVKSFKEGVDVYANLSHMIERRVAVGEITELDYVRVQAEHRNAQSRLAEAQADLKSAQEFFLTLLQIPFNSTDVLQLDGTLVTQKIGMGLDDAIERALASQASLKAANLDVLAARLQVNAIIGTYFPRVEAFARVSDASSAYDVDNHVHGWMGGVRGSWELFDGFERAGSRRVARASLRASEIRRGEQCNEVVSQIREIYSKIESFATSIDAQYSVVGLRKREFSETHRFYDHGMVPFKDVLDAQRRLIDSQIELSMVIARSNSSVYQFEYWIGSMPDSALPCMNCMVND